MKQRGVSVVVSQFAFLVLIGLYTLSATAEVSPCIDSAQQYWKAFRIAAIRSNLSVVANMSQFPFELRGTLDESDKRQVLCKEFIRLFPTLLNTDPGLSPTPTTMKSLLTTTTRLLPSFCNSYGNQFRVGAWVFQLTPDGWRFVQAFVDN